ncbi:hypothetical protein JCM10207_006337 [Rhodosporidiobolus poonsookiae]
MSSSSSSDSSSRSSSESPPESASSILTLSFSSPGPGVYSIPFQALYEDTKKELESKTPGIAQKKVFKQVEKKWNEKAALSVGQELLTAPATIPSVVQETDKPPSSSPTSTMQGSPALEATAPTPATPSGKKKKKRRQKKKAQGGSPSVVSG